MPVCGQDDGSIMATAGTDATCYTVEQAQRAAQCGRETLSKAIRRGDIRSWKLENGRRLIDRSSVHAWIAARAGGQRELAL